MGDVVDYYTFEQLARKLNIAEAALEELEVKGLLQPKVKDGRKFISCRQAYDLRAALRLARKQKLPLERAFAMVEDLRLCQVGAEES
jgi:hypothetical protein